MAGLVRLAHLRSRSQRRLALGLAGLDRPRLHLLAADAGFRRPPARGPYAPVAARSLRRLRRPHQRLLPAPAQTLKRLSQQAHGAKAPPPVKPVAHVRTIASRRSAQMVETDLSKFDPDQSASSVDQRP